jgi:hypothetical protein
VFAASQDTLNSSTTMSFKNNFNLNFELDQGVNKKNNSPEG